MTSVSCLCPSVANELTVTKENKAGDERAK
jgi:hypothetical protein